MIIHQMEQRTDEWRAIRAGKLTASNAQAIAACGAGLETLVYKTVAEKYSSGKYKNYSNESMERGNDLEDVARTLYAMERSIDIQQVGFIEYNEFVGFSPDGLVGEDGGIEIKCHDDAVHLRFIISEKVESKYIWQIQMALLITGRAWWDYVAYNPNFAKGLIVKRISPDKKAHEKLIEGFKIGAQKIQFIEANLKFKQLN